MIRKARKLGVAVVLDVVHRWWLLLWIPWRIVSEMFLNYIWTPKRIQETPATADYFQTGLGDRKTALKSGLDYWWKPNPASPNVLLQRKLATQILLPLVADVYIHNVLGRKRSKESLASKTPLLGARICDIQCGAGFLSECLVDAGAEVTGIDTTDNTIMIARAHWQKTKGNRERPTYLVMSAAELAKQRVVRYDVVVCSEPLNQSINWRAILRDAAKLVRPDGCIVVCSANRTLPSFAWNIIGLEHVIGLSEKGSHRFHQFVRDRDVAAEIKKAGTGDLEILSSAGIYPVGWGRWNFNWVQTGHTGLWYTLVIKRKSGETS